MIDFVKALADLQYQLLMEMGSPVRGCVSVGDYSRVSDGKNVLLAGSPLLEAYGYEQKQNWVGVILAPSIIKKIPELRNNTYISESERFNDIYKQMIWSFNLQRYAEIPFRKGIYDGYVVIPHSDAVVLPDDLIEELDLYVNQLDMLKLSSPSSDTQTKYENSFKFIKKIVARYRATFGRVGWKPFLSTKKEQET